MGYLSVAAINHTEHQYIFICIVSSPHSSKRRHYYLPSDCFVALERLGNLPKTHRQKVAVGCPAPRPLVTATSRCDTCLQEASVPAECHPVTMPALSTEVIWYPPGWEAPGRAQHPAQSQHFVKAVAPSMLLPSLIPSFRTQ